jgi:hypothetical protein
MTQAANLAALGTNAGTTGILPIAGGGTAGTGGAIGFKNRIINGAMTIDQRNAGASVSMTSGTYSVDRFRVFASVGSKMTAQQNAGSVTPPAGFTNYLGFTTTAGYSPSASERFMVYQGIEGTNTADLNWGSANAKTVTLSFWVRSSLTGTHSGALNNDAGDRSYVFSFTISSANTWEYKTITVAGDTSGTWLSTNSGGIYLYFNLGNGSSYLTTAGSWQAGYYLGATGSVSVVGTTGATFYVTGVQLEVGTAATNFDVRSYGTELQLCQRYYWTIVGVSGVAILPTPYNGSTSNQWLTLQTAVTMRAAPTVTSGDWSGGAPSVTYGSPSYVNFNFTVGTYYFSSSTFIRASAEL